MHLLNTWNDAKRRLKILLHDYGWWLLGLLALLALLLGALGFQQYYAALGQTLTWRDLLYAAIRLFNLESGQVDGALPWPLEIARWLAPAVLFYAVIYGFLLATHEHVGWLRAHRYHHHVILCGLDEKSARLAQDLLDRQPRPRLIAIDPNPQLDTLNVLRDRGLILLPGLSTDEVMLRKAGVDRARYLIAVTGHDEENLEIAAKAFEQTATAGKTLQPPNPLTCYVQVTNIGLRQVFYDHPLFATDYPYFDGRLFNLYERGARRLLAEAAPDHLCPVHGPQDPSPQILIVGLGALGQQVALQAARLGHYANFRRLRLTVIDADGGARERYLRSLYPVLSEIVDWRYRDAADYGANSEQLTEWVRDPALAVVYVCLDNDAQGLNIARRYHQHLQASAAVVVSLSQHTHLAEVIAPSAGAQSPLFYPNFAPLSYDHLYPSLRPILVFDLIDRAFRARQVLDEELDQLAKALHDHYREPLLQQGQTGPGLLDWSELSETLQDSNRYQADFLPVRLRLLGYRLRRQPADADSRVLLKDFEVPEDQLDTLARMEHTRWVAERRLAGWTLGDPRDDSRKRHPDLLPYDQLSAEKQEARIRAPLRQLPNVLRDVLPLLDWSLVRLPPNQ